MAATISLQNINSNSGYFNISIKVTNTGVSALSGVHLRPVYITLPDGSVIADPQFGNLNNPSYDPYVLASWILPTIAAGSTYTQISLLPILSSLYQSSNPHTCQFLVVQEGVAILSNTLNVVITPVTDDYFADPIISSFHNNTDILRYQGSVSSTGYINAFTSNLDNVNLGTTATLQMVSTSANDTQMYRILGLNSSGNVQLERGLLTGTTVLNSRSSFSYLYDFYLSSPAIGTVMAIQSSLTYVTVLPTYNRSSGFRFADNRPRLIHSIETGDNNVIYLKLTVQEFGAGAITEISLFERYFAGPIYLYPPIYVAANSIVRGYIKVDGPSAVNVYGTISTAPIYGF